MVTVMMNRYICQIHHLSLARYHTNISLCRMKNKVQLKLMGQPFVLPVFGHELKCWTNFNLDLVVK